MFILCMEIKNKQTKIEKLARGYTHEKNSEKNFQLSYPSFFYNGLDPRVHLEDYLWKMSNIVGKNHRH